MYVPRLLSIRFVLSKIWPGQATVMKNKWLWGDNSVNIPGRIMVIMHSHLSIQQVPLQSLIPQIWPGQATLMKTMVKG